MVNFTCIKKRSILFLFLIGVSFVNAQENERYTQYLYNPTSINPAFAGSRGVTSILSSYRAQWVDVPGAPTTIMLSANGVSKNEKIGVGLSVLNDEIGPADQSAIALDFAYILKLSPKYNLAFGLKASANLLNVDFTKLYLKDGTEPIYQDNIDNKFSPNVGFGFLLKSDKSSFGVSIPNLLETKFYDKYASNASNSSIAKENLNIYLTADYLFELSPNLMLKPALLVKVVKDGDAQTYASANFMINQALTLGMSYRFGGTISNLAGFQVTKKMFIGYAYDLETRSMRNYNTASHEVFIRFDLSAK
jgi:type IX secretion system PorP/SprF family membrane protein